jgi:hypothetical protein
MFIETLQLFYVGAEGAVTTRWRNRDGSWSGEQNLGGAAASQSVAACVVPGTEILQLLYVASGAGVRTRWRNPDGSWSSEQHLGGVALSDVTAVLVR